ncbi:MAG: hypothetical protein AB1324_05050, partial [Candidatus Micrarchaeota archaeon]
MAEAQKKRKRGGEDFAQQKPILDERRAERASSREPERKPRVPSPEEVERTVDALRRSRLTLKDMMEGPTRQESARRFAESAKGHEAPSPRIETRREGRRRLRERDREIRKELRQSDIPKEELRERRRETAKGRMVRFSQFLTEGTIGRRKFRRESDEVCGWMTEDPEYLGSAVRRRLERTPPMATFAGEGHFARRELLGGEPAIAYFPDSNNLIFNSRLMGEDRAA